MKELFTALAKAQGQIEAAVKDKTNPVFRSKYADLAAVWEACRKALSANGLAVLQFPLHSEDDKLHLETIITHSSGESISKVFSIPVDKRSAHGYGSAITYARRFALAAAIGIVADEDDDGNQASIKASKSTNAVATVDISKEGKARVEAVLSKVIDWLANDSADDAYLELENAGFDSDEKTYLWNFLDSKQRSAIKKAGEAMRKQNEAAFNTPLNA